MPSVPARGPDLIRSRSPVFRKGCGVSLYWQSVQRRSAGISEVGITAGLPPKESIAQTPGVDTMTSFFSTPSARKTYPGKSGKESFLLRSFHLRTDSYVGQKTSNPLFDKIDATLTSC